MWNVNTEVTPIIKGATGSISKSFRKYLSHILGNEKINYRKQPHWTLHTYCGEYQCKSTNHSALEIALHVPCIVITE
jgi:hypothetical protein